MYVTRGVTFRSAFRKTGGLRALTSAPFMALTASAPPSAEADLKSQLEMCARNCVTMSLPLDCPNIYISLCKKRSLSVSCSLKLCAFLFYCIFIMYFCY